MARIRYFSDVTGEAVQLKAPRGMPNDEFSSRWPDVRGIHYDGYQKWVGRADDGINAGSPLMPVTRMIDYKAQPSLHECNAKCLNGKHNGVCECRCGGANHGRGLFAQEERIAA